MTQLYSIELEADRYEDTREISSYLLELGTHKIEVSELEPGYFTADLIGSLGGWNVTTNAARPELAAALLRQVLAERGFSVPTKTIYA